MLSVGDRDGDPFVSTRKVVSRATALIEIGLDFTGREERDGRSDEPRKDIGAFDRNVADEIVLATAFAAAKPFNAHVAALFIHPDPRLAAPFVGVPVCPRA